MRLNDLLHLSGGLFASLMFVPCLLSAQCTKVGWVINNSACGAKIIDVDSGEILFAVSGNNGLLAGQTVCFNTVPATMSQGCPTDTFTVVGLSDVSSQLPCKASFYSYPNKLNAFTVHFSAHLYNPATQTCHWDFGDGTIGTGQHTQHTFPYEGFFPVKLTVKDNGTCVDTHTENIYISEQNGATCGYELSLTAVELDLLGSLKPISSGAWPISSVKWYYGKSNETLSLTPELDVQLPNYGAYNVCVDIKTVNPDDNSACESTLCHHLSINEPNCTSNLFPNTSLLCPPLYAPVCGCDGNTYYNECEALMAGTTAWWAGVCNAPNTNNCFADMQTKVISGNPAHGYTVRFYNFSNGNFSNLQIDFGDGSSPIEVYSDSIEHHYAVGGIYLANLTAWKNTSCVSSFTKIIATDVASIENEIIPEGMDYVLPGDANRDGKANVYDLLNVGVGYFTNGIPRPLPSTSWLPQLAPQWMQATGKGINFKHLDCTGDGVINELEPGVIYEHYTPLDTTEIPPTTTAPKLWLRFPQYPNDTIYVQNNPTGSLDITADIMVGSPGAPVFDLYGVAFALNYPEYVGHDPQASYDDNSMFGFSNNILWMRKDHYDRRQFDMGFVRKNGVGVPVLDRIAQITFKADFIIIVDIIDRNSSNITPFILKIRSLKAIDANGVEKEMSVPTIQDTLWIKKVESVGTAAPETDILVNVSPNPAASVATIATAGLKIISVNVLNGLGQVVQETQHNGAPEAQIDMAALSAGIYSLQIMTDRGRVIKQLSKK